MKEYCEKFCATYKVLYIISALQEGNDNTATTIVTGTTSYFYVNVYFMLKC